MNGFLMLLFFLLTLYNAQSDNELTDVRSTRYVDVPSENVDTPKDVGKVKETKRIHQDRNDNTQRHSGLFLAKDAESMPPLHHIEHEEFPAEVWPGPLGENPPFKTQLKEGIIKHSQPELNGVSNDIFELRAALSRMEAYLENTVQELENIKQETKALKENLQQQRDEIHGLAFVESNEVSSDQVIGFQADIDRLPRTYPDGVVLKLSHCPHNPGSAYNSTNGVFTAPVEGYYLFWCHILNLDPVQALSIYMMRNGKTFAYAQAPPNTRNGVASTSIFVHMKRGHTIWLLKFRGSENILGAGWSTFGGTLIKQL